LSSNGVGNMNLKRLLLAFALAPLATPLFFAAVWVVRDAQNFVEYWPLLYVIALFAYGAALLFGVPLVRLTRHSKKPTVALFAAAGMAAGLLVALIPGAVMNWFGGFLFYLMCGLAGGLSGFTFWLIAFVKRREPLALSPG